MNSIYNSAIIFQHIPYNFLNNDGYYIVYVEVDNEFGKIGYTTKPVEHYIYDLMNKYKSYNIILKLVINMRESIIRPYTIKNNIIHENRVYKYKPYGDDTFKIKYFDYIFNNIKKNNNIKIIYYENMSFDNKTYIYIDEDSETEPMTDSDNDIDYDPYKDNDIDYESDEDGDNMDCELDEDGDNMDCKLDDKMNIN